ncbi:flagellar export protein FliJ [Rubripirellula amarantea]|nr:flagellar export protein FliJ [Rubripirellula amarantea]
MAKYRSQLATLHQLRSSARDAQRSRVADALRAEAAVAEQLQAVDTEIENAKNHQRQRRSGQMQVTALLEIERYELVLKAQAASLAKQQEAVAGELERRRTALSAAEQQVRVVEKLDERRRNDFKQAEDRREQKEMDEIATQQFLRNRQPLN